MKQLNFVLATDSKIVSINSLYGAKVGWKAGRPYPQLYRSQSAMRFEREVRDQLLALHLDKEWIDWFKTTKHFSMTVNFILRTGVTRRDVSNCDKALIDTITRFIKYDLGCDDFDDSLFSDVHFYKSTIPQGNKEYCCVQITESTHEIRFDVIPKPETLWFYGSLRPDLPKVPKRKKKSETYIEEVEDKEKANTFIYYITPDMEITPELFYRISEDKTRVLKNGAGFLYLGILGNLEVWEDSKNLEYLEFLKKEFKEAHEQYSGIYCQLLGNDINESLKWIKQ